MDDVDESATINEALESEADDVDSGDIAEKKRDEGFINNNIGL